MNLFNQAFYQKKLASHWLEPLMQKTHIEESSNFFSFPHKSRPKIGDPFSLYYLCIVYKLMFKKRNWCKTNIVIFPRDMCYKTNSEINFYREREESTTMENYGLF